MLAVTKVKMTAAKKSEQEDMKRVTRKFLIVVVQNNPQKSVQSCFFAN